MSSSSSPTHYALLQLTPSATADELRQAFRSLSKRYHPDTTSLPAHEAAQGFLRLQQAYAVLSNPDARRRYDAELSGPSTPNPAVVATAVSPSRPVPVRRALSGGEWLALLLLGVALVLSLLLGVGLAWARGMELAHLPSWWPPA